MQKPKLYFTDHFDGDTWFFELANRRGGSIVVNRDKEKTMAVMVVDPHAGDQAKEQLAAMAMSASLDLARCIYESARGRAAHAYYTNRHEPPHFVGWKNIEQFVDNRWGDFLTVAEQTALMKGGFIKTERIL